MNAQETARYALKERARLAVEFAFPAMNESRLVIWQQDIFDIALRKHERFVGSYLSPAMGDYYPIYFHFNDFLLQHPQGYGIMSGFLCGNGADLACILFAFDAGKVKLECFPLIVKAGSKIGNGVAGLIALREFLNLKLAADTSILLPRHERRALAKQNSAPPDIRLISLREREPTGWHAGTARQYKYRWITDGHWRRLPEPLKRDSKRSGGKQGDHVVWIVPHEKGPSGAPLLAQRPTVWVAHR